METDCFRRSEASFQINKGKGNGSRVFKIAEQNLKVLYCDVQYFIQDQFGLFIREKHFYSE